MNGSEIIIVIDTNVIFMALYKPLSKAGKIIQYAFEEKIKLYAPDTVKEEIIRVLKRELKFTEKEIISTISTLPINWIEKEIYESKLIMTSVKHKPDKPVEALSLVLNCDILSADHHFKNRKNINKLLQELENI